MQEIVVCATSNFVVWRLRSNVVRRRAVRGSARLTRVRHCRLRRPRALFSSTWHLRRMLVRRRVLLLRE